MAQQRRNHYDEEFKRRAVLHHIGSHGTLGESAERFGITAGMLSKWIELYRPETNPGSMNCEAEILHMKEELKALKQIVSKAILQKYSVDDIVDKMLDDPEKFLSED